MKTLKSLGRRLRAHIAAVHKDYRDHWLEWQW